MPQITESQIRQIVEEVVQQLRPAGGVVSSTASGGGASGDRGVFGRVDDAVAAAARAQAALMEQSLEQRKAILDAVRQVSRDNAEEFSRRALDETGIGRLEDKILKHNVAADTTPGIEDLEAISWTGDHGLTVVEMAPYGVIAAVTPSTHPVPTMVNNAISFVAAGNAAVFNVHPSAVNVSMYAVRLLHQAIVAAGGPADLITAIAEPTVESATQLFNHRGIRLILVTGGPAVARAAFNSPKKAVIAGPGNPPVVVDETADIPKAARDIVDGAGFDNNVLCIGEKQVFVVESVAGELKSQMVRYSAYELDARQIEQLTEQAFVRADDGKLHPDRDLVGRSAWVLGKRIGLSLDEQLRLLIGETGLEHPFVQEEQMMPFLPIVRVPNVDQAIRAAIESEHGYGHTAVIHSRNVENMHNMARAANTTIFVKNGPSYAGLGLGGEGFGTYSVAGPTGEGLTSARTFTRQRRCSLVDYFRIT